ncbi:hypothetical protein K493DRAFT_346846 [Basidiobolus meristosporus CBS 931.73]|uniref:Uncharacterized protein n=1 Tax=Basidiobolus meristosporus CBS 931.73 TaxID=1314790 RepID=A0A1Y1YXE3_9FUNG|nr:hypothetical protein K493DRAFT_346846 [Basidiobolus meristosporus CBS 931.73]|eukprot:ORY02235.1 hypothetical protein K493DRAFT_346846 [Basidiobolus meristosporus CBS 931.73]
MKHINSVVVFGQSGCGTYKAKVASQQFTFPLVDGLPQYLDIKPDEHPSQDHDSLRDSYKSVVDLNQHHRFESEHELVDHKKYDLDDELWLDELQRNGTGHSWNPHQNPQGYDNRSAAGESQFSEVSGQPEESLGSHAFIKPDEDSTDAATEAAIHYEDASCQEMESLVSASEAELCVSTHPPIEEILEV